MSVFVSASADVADSAVVGPSSRIWHLAQISDEAVLGA
jgi:UDP-2-acetamido-3-amino-2,3-dideoxy-glucuronate N-acetyltransferase